MHKCNAVTAWFRDHQEFTVSLTRSQPHRKFMGYNGKPSGSTVMRERLMCSNAITWKCGRASAEILSYASSWCSQCDVECRTALTTGLWQNPLPAKTPSDKNPNPASQKPPLTKTPLQVKVLRLHAVITKNWQVNVIVKTKCHWPPNLT